MVKKIFLSFFVLITIVEALVIQPKSISHRGIINDIVISKDRVITVANDDTLKIWSKLFLDLKDTFYAKGEKQYQQLYTVAIYKNYIVTAGVNGLQNSILVLDKTTHKLVKNLKHNFNVISKLLFNPLNGMLLVVSGDSLYFYDENFKFLGEKDFSKYGNKYQQSIYDAVFVGKDNVIFVNWDGYVVMYNLKLKKVVAHKHFDSRLQAIDIVDGKIYVGAYNGYVYVLDKNLVQKDKILIDSNFMVLDIKHSDDKLIVAGGSNGFAVIKNDKLLFKKNPGFVKAVAIDGENIYVGKNNILQKYRLDKLKEQTDENIYKINIDIGICNTWFYLNYPSIYENFVLCSYYTSKSHTINGVQYTYRITSDYSKLAILKNNEIVQIYKRDASSGYRHKVVLWYKNYLISGGDYGYVFIYNLNNDNELFLLDGLQNHIKSMAIKNETLVVLDEKENISLFNLKNLSNNLKPYMKITLFYDHSFLMRSGSYFYTDNPHNVVCLKPKKHSFVQTTTCKSNKKRINKILHKNN